jgi:hypothetical protein
MVQRNNPGLRCSERVRGPRCSENVMVKIVRVDAQRVVYVTQQSSFCLNPLLKGISSHQSGLLSLFSSCATLWSRVFTQERLFTFFKWASEKVS